MLQTILEAQGAATAGTFEIPPGVNPALELMASRRSVSSFQLRAPGPSTVQLATMLTIAARVPDHGALVPFRFITISAEGREAVSRQMAAALLASKGAEPDEMAQNQARRIASFFSTPPLMIVVVSCINPQSHISPIEQALCAGAVCMNLLQAAHAHGFGANWLTGWTADSPVARAILGLSTTETIAGLIPIGSFEMAPADRSRPSLDDIVTRWTDISAE